MNGPYVLPFRIFPADLPLFHLFSTCKMLTHYHAVHSTFSWLSFSGVEDP
jgi:hypothetical protein